MGHAQPPKSLSFPEQQLQYWTLFQSRSSDTATKWIHSEINSGDNYFKVVQQTAARISGHKPGKLASNK